MCQVRASHSPAAEIMHNVPHVNEAVRDRIHSVVTEFIDILLGAST